MNLDGRQKLLAALAIGTVVLLAGDRLVLAPLISTWKARTERITALRASVNDGAKLIQRDAALRTRWTAMRGNMLTNEVSLAESQLLRAFDRWSQESRVGINALKPQWKRSNDDHLALECRVDASGSLSSLTRFLYEIEKDPLGIKVDLVELAARDDNGEQLTLAIQVSGLQFNPASKR